MNEDTFNMEIRKFLKKVGITAQREVTNSVMTAISDGKLKGNESLPIVVNLSLPGADLELEVGGDISLE